MDQAEKLTKIKKLAKFSQNSQLAIFEEVQNINDKLAEVATKVVGYEAPEQEQLIPLLTDIKTVILAIEGKALSFDEITVKLDTLVKAVQDKNLTVEIKDRTDEVLQALKTLTEAVSIDEPTEYPTIDLSPLETAIQTLQLPLQNGRVPVKLDPEDLKALGEGVGKGSIIAFGGGGAQLKILAQLQTLNTTVANSSSPTYDTQASTDSGYDYLGKATPGTATSAGTWQIARFNANGAKSYANGTALFDKTWANRTTYTYTN